MLRPDVGIISKLLLSWVELRSKTELQWLRETNIAQSGDLDFKPKKQLWLAEYNYGSATKNTSWESNGDSTGTFSIKIKNLAASVARAARAKWAVLTQIVGLSND